MSHLKTVYGIDIGKATLHIAQATGTRPKKYPVDEIHLTDPEWYLKMPITSPCLIVVEPTGTHYIHPIIEACHQRKINAEIWLINNDTTRAIRETHVGRAKTDKMDAQALAHAGIMIQAGNPPQLARPLNIANDEIIYILRLLLNDYKRHVKEETRALNRLDQLLHSIFPAYAIRKLPAITAIKFGALTPAEIYKLAWLSPTDRPEGYTGNHARHTRQLSDELPTHIEIHPAKRQMIEKIVHHIEAIRERQAELSADISNILADEFTYVTKLWRTIPYSHDIAIASYIIACGNMFQNPKQFANALGVAPMTKSSGSTEGTLKPRGYRYSRSSIHMQIIGILRSDNAITRYFQRGKSLGACKRKLANIMYAMIINNTPYEER